MSWGAALLSFLSGPGAVAVALAATAIIVTIINQRHRLQLEDAPRPRQALPPPPVRDRPRSPLRRRRPAGNDVAPLEGFRSAGCDLCSKPFEQNDTTTSLLCGHQFHRNCAEKWIETCCPTCREPAEIILQPPPNKKSGYESDSGNSQKTVVNAVRDGNPEMRKEETRENTAASDQSDARTHSTVSSLNSDMTTSAVGSDGQRRKVSSKCPLCDKRVEGAQEFIVKKRNKFHKMCLRDIAINLDDVVPANACKACLKPLPSQLQGAQGDIASTWQSTESTGTTILSCGCVFHTDCSEKLRRESTVCVSCGSDLEQLEEPQCLLCGGTTDLERLSCSCRYHEKCLNHLLSKRNNFYKCPNCDKLIVDSKYIINCSICMNSIQEEPKRLHCGHVFHETCIAIWEKEQIDMKGSNCLPVCPNCRQSYDIDLDFTFL